MTPDTITQLREAIAAWPTPFPLQTVPTGHGPIRLAIADSDRVSLLTIVHEGGTKFAAFFSDDDAVRVVASYNAAPALLAEVDRLRAALELIANAENSALDLAYCKGVARAALGMQP